MPGAVKQGDVYWYHEDSRKRPVLILTRDSAIVFLDEIVVAPITKKVRQVPSFVNLEDASLGEVAINLDAIERVKKTRLGTFVTRLANEQLLEVRKAIGFALGFDDLEED
jgi:mRNA interferase MazF